MMRRKVRRRDALRAMATAGATGVTAGSVLAAPAIAQGGRELTMVTSWPKDLVGVGTTAQRLAERITEGSDGRLRVTVAAAGELVEAFEVFDAVSAGVAEMYHSADYYWIEHSPAFAFFSTVPFGLTANELTTWIHWGGGQELWDELSGGFGIKPLLAGNSGLQMGGWYNEEIHSVESFKGLRYRMAGLGGEVLKELGATVVNVPGGKIIDVLRTGAIDAAEWAGPGTDMALGLHEVAKYYYYPTFQEPGVAYTCGINKGVWEEFSAAEQSLIASAAAAENSFSLAEINADNADALVRLKAEHPDALRRFDDETLRGLREASAKVLAERMSGDPLRERIYQSFLAFREKASAWSDVADRAYLSARSLG